MNSLRDIDIKFIKGIGPNRARLLEKHLGIKSAYDLLYYFPHSYLDRTSFYKISQFQGEMPNVQVRGRFISFRSLGEGARERYVGAFSDGTNLMEVTWFRRLKYIKQSVLTNREYILFGRPTRFNNTWQMVHPEIESGEISTSSLGLRGVYPLTEGLRNAGIGSRQFFGWQQSALTLAPLKYHETLPKSLVASLKLMPLPEALATIHFPSDNESLQRAKLRLKFDELFMIQIQMIRRGMNRKATSIGHRFKVIGQYFNDFYNKCLPFTLTDAQKRVIREIRVDVNTGHQMNRLVQGDVGSGKTLVALMAMLMALDNGCQAALMAPTEILATQHYETISKMVEPIGIQVALLTGSTPAAKRRAIHNALTDGSLHILIGTHALIEDTVSFRNLGIAIIDEQHRFGVAQRSKLWTKNAIPPHILVMTATPIPRTLAMTVYGNLDVSVIDQLPPGRKPITTRLCTENGRTQVYRELYSRLTKGEQAYIVFPVIEENEKTDLRSVKEGYEAIKAIFPEFQVAFVHGRMKPDEKDSQMQLFASGQAQILVATTVIEVGVNVPAATTMIIENAERFGLSQLHQLRGRVGRGGDQSYCILMSKSNIADTTRKRLDIMTATTDGFIIAEADMKLRGPGDIEGTMQSGLPFVLNIANLATDGHIVQLARSAASRLLDNDPTLSLPENRIIASTVESVYGHLRDWSSIS